MKTIKIPHCIINVDHICNVSVCREAVNEFEIVFDCVSGRRCETGFKIESAKDADEILDAIGEYLNSPIDNTCLEISSLIESAS